MIISEKQIIHLMALSSAFGEILIQADMNEEIQNNIAWLLKEIHDQQSDKLIEIKDE